LPSSASIVTVRATVLSVPLTLAIDDDAFMPSVQADFEERIRASVACFIPICYVELYMLSGSLTANLVYPTTVPAAAAGSTGPLMAANATVSAASFALATSFFEMSDAASLSSALGQQVQAVAPTTVRLDQERSLAITSTAAPQSSSMGGGGGSPSWLVSVACVLVIVLIALGTLIALKTYRRRRREAALLVKEYTGKASEDARASKFGRTELVALSDGKLLSSQI
jgi:hypothetical protein